MKIVITEAKFILMLILGLMISNQIYSNYQPFEGRNSVMKLLKQTNTDIMLKINLFDTEFSIDGSKFRKISTSVEGGITQTLIEKWENNTWNNVRLTTYTFDEISKLSNWLMQKWEGGSWINDLKSITQLDENFYPVEDITQKWENNEWKNYAKDMYQYNSNYDMTEMLFQAWNDTTDTWVNSMRMVNQYDGNFNLIEDLMEFWKDNAWEGFQLGTHTYNSKNLLTNSLTRLWFETEWMDWSRITYTYNDKDLCTDELHEAWNFVSWNTSAHWTYEYNDQDQEVVRIMEDFDPFTTARTDYDRVLSSYDGDLLVEEISQEWGGADWVNTDLETYTYEDGQLTVILWQVWQDDQWVNFERWTNSYDGTVAVNFEQGIPTDFTLYQNYPNPFNPSTTISYTVAETDWIEVGIYDILGNCIFILTNKKHIPGSYSLTFNAIDLSSGTYFIRLKNKSQIITKKCLLLK